MARRLENQENVQAPDSDYPLGRIKDNTGANDGTPVNEAVYGDIHQFFAKLMSDAVIVPNGLPDNDYTGFQLNQALQAFNERLKQFNGLAQSIIGETYSSSSIYILKGLNPYGTNQYYPGWILYNDVIYYSDGKSSVTAIADTLVFIVPVALPDDPTNINTLDIIDTTSGGGLFDLADCVYINDPWHYIGGAGEPAFQNSWSDGAPDLLDATFAPRFRKKGNYIELGGAWKSGASPGAVITTFPTGYIPASKTVLGAMRWSSIATTHLAVPQIDISGQLSIVGSGIVSGDILVLDGLILPLD